MIKAEQMEDKQYIFGALFTVANRMDTLLERELKEFGITTKQWFLSIIIDSLFEEPPTMKEAARESGSSHQNVKQVALKLQEKGLVSLEKDKKDSRVTRLKMTEQSNMFWEKTQPRAIEFTEDIFRDIDQNDLASARTVLQKIFYNLSERESRNGNRND